MSNDWDGNAEPFQIHAEGWAVIAIVAFVVIAGLAHAGIWPTSQISLEVPPANFERIPRIGPVGAPVVPGQCGQADVGGSFHRIECPR